MVRVRFAPSPTGIPHLGNTRTALYNYLFAKHHQGQFILRIEDTDQNRLVPESLDKILEILKFLGINWDQGPYLQSQRLKLYHQYAHQLLDQGLAYQDEGAIRFKVPPGHTLTWQDLIQGQVSFKSDDLTDPVLLKSDGFPTYHLAVVVDDHLMQISHILRAAEWISSTPKHLLIYQALGWAPPQIGHFSVILGPDKTKLSKRHGAKSILDYKDEGYLPDALLTFMSYLGWSYQDNSQLLTLKDLVKHFDLKSVHQQNPIFDQAKLDYFNAKLIRATSAQTLLKLLKPFIPKDCSPALAKKILPLVHERLVKLSQFQPLTAFFYQDITLDKQLLLKTTTNLQAQAQLKMTISTLKPVSPWTAKQLEAVLRQLSQNNSFRPGQFFMLLRVAVTGKAITPPLFDTLQVLGKNKTLARLAHAQKLVQ